MSREELIIELAKFMHDEYERAALVLGWDTQESCRVPFENLPQNNRETTLCVAQKVYEKYIESEHEPTEFTKELRNMTTNQNFQDAADLDIRECLIASICEKSNEACDIIDNLQSQIADLEAENASLTAELEEQAQKGDD